jgi:acyl dehydratase
LKPGTPHPVKEIILDAEKIYCFEDFRSGEGGETDSRTITEADIVNFAGITGDYNPQYVDVEFARRSIFGERIAHGMLVFTNTVGLWSRNWIRYQEAESDIAGHLNDRAEFLATVKIGDTISCRYETLEARTSKSRSGLGIVRFGFQSINQRNELVQKSSVLFMVPTRAWLGIQSRL